MTNSSHATIALLGDADGQGTKCSKCSAGFSAIPSHYTILLLICSCVDRVDSTVDMSLRFCRDEKIYRIVQEADVP